MSPGQFGRIRAVTELLEGAIVVPQRAVTELQGQARVVVVDDKNKVSFRTVDLGPRVGSAYVVHSGLAAGERVVIEGLQRLRDGIVVQPTVGEINADSLMNRK